MKTAHYPDAAPALVGAIYIRESATQTGFRLEVSFDRQRTLCEERAGIMSVPIVPIFAERISGRAHRKMKEMSECIAAAERKAFNALFIERADRLGRNSLEVRKNLARFRSAGVKVFDAAGVEIDNFFGAIIAEASEHESIIAGDRMSDARRAKIEHGRALGMKIYGYSIDVEDRYQIDDSEAPAVVLSYAMYADETSLQKICHELDARGYRPPGATREWSRDHLLRHFGRSDGSVEISGLLGKHCFSGTRITATYRTTFGPDGSVEKRAHPDGPIARPLPAIVNEAVDQAVKARIARDHKTRPHAFEGSDYLFKEVLCKICKRPLTLGNGQNLACRPWGRTAVLVCEGWDASACSNDRSVEMGALQLGVLQATADFLRKFNTAEVFRSAWRRTLEDDARARNIPSPDEVARDVKAARAALADAVRKNAADACDDAAAAVRIALAELQALKVLLATAEGERDKAPQPPDVESSNAAIARFLETMPRRIDDVADPSERQAYESLRHLFKSVSAISPKDGFIEFEVETVAGTFAATAWVRFLPLGEHAAILLDALTRAGKRGVDAAGLREASIAGKQPPNEKLKASRRLIGLGYVVVRGDRWVATGRKPLVIGGKTVLVRIDFTKPTSTLE